MALSYKIHLTNSIWPWGNREEIKELEGKSQTEERLMGQKGWPSGQNAGTQAKWSPQSHCLRKEEQIKKVTTRDWSGQLRALPALEGLSLAVGSYHEQLTAACSSGSEALTRLASVGTCTRWQTPPSHSLKTKHIFKKKLKPVFLNIFCFCP